MYYRLYMYGPCAVWAIDEGDPSKVKHFDEVFVESYGSTNENIESQDDPMRWIEFYDAILLEEDGIAYLQNEVA